MYKAHMRITSTKWQHLQQLKKVLPKDYHHFYDALPPGDWILETGYWRLETGDWRLDTEHRNFVSFDSKAGTPGHQRNILTSLRIRTCMVFSRD